jgi:hypothetical protein
MKRVGVCILLVASLILTALPGANAAATPGSKCSKVGVKQTYRGKVYTCIKLGKKLYWNNGVKVTKPRPIPTPKPTPTPTPTPTKPTLQVLESHFGKEGSRDCWITLRVKNSNQFVSPRFVVTSEIISDKGLYIPGIYNYIPSLDPGEEYWSYQSQICLNDENPAKTTIKSITEYGYYLNNERDRGVSGERPKILSVKDLLPNQNYKVKGKYEIQIQNNSPDKTLGPQTLIQIVYFDSNSKPTGGWNGRLNRSIPPSITGTLSFTDFDQITSQPIPNHSSFKVSVSQYLCNNGICNY